ncbi:MAG: hypothetical protein M0T70_13785 [Geobacteraceae bacterium]|nr:hypothetical protein [Geobacteraceae bacterium]
MPSSLPARASLYAWLSEPLPIEDSTLNTRLGCPRRSPFGAGIDIPVIAPQIADVRHDPTVLTLKFPHLARFKKMIQNFWADHIKSVIYIFNPDEHDNLLSS